MNLRLKVVATLPFLLLLGACTEEPKPAAVKKEVKPAEPVTALTAIYKMYQQARGWAPDCFIQTASNMDVKEVKGGEGKMAAWEATFISHAKRQSRRFTYSVIEVPGSNLREGVFGGEPETWSPVGNSQAFAMQYLKIDTNAAYATALPKAKEYASKHPDMPVKFLLQWVKKNYDPTWRVYWGETVETSGFSVYVDAMTGNYVSTEH